MIDLKVKRLNPDVRLPTYATDGSACFDLHVCTPDRYSEAVHPGEQLVFYTGVAFEVPDGYALMIYSRSGHGFGKSVRLANCVGVIDSDYRGEVLVKLTSDAPPGEFPLYIEHGDRIAQAMLVEVPKVRLVEVDELSQTERGTGGFGSTGVA